MPNNCTCEATEYEDYSATSKVYDKRRKAIGVNHITDAISKVMQQTGRDRKDIRLLDAGCGTGNYIVEVAKYVGQVQGFDYNEGMLEQAKKKCKGLKNVSFDRGSLLELPYSDNTFDIIIMNQVLHHIAGTEKDKNVQTLFAHFARVLKDGGAVVINTQDPQQHIDGFWWAEIIPDAVQRLADRLVTIEDTEKLLRNVGFDHVKSYVPEDPLMNVEAYLDVQGPFKKEFRDGDSTWSLATTTELQEGLKWYQETYVDKHKEEEYLRNRELVRSKVGQTTSMVAFRPLASA